MAIDPVSSSPSVRLGATDSAALARLADGATLEAKVVGRHPNGVARLQIGGAVIEAKAPPSLTVGSTVALTVSRTPDGVRLLLPALPGAAQGASPQAPAAPVLTTLVPPSAGGQDGAGRGGVSPAPPAGMPARPPISGAPVTIPVPLPADPLASGRPAAGVGGAVGSAPSGSGAPVTTGVSIEGQVISARPTAAPLARAVPGGSAPGGLPTSPAAVTVGAMPGVPTSAPMATAGHADGVVVSGVAGQPGASEPALGSGGGTGAPTTAKSSNAAAPPPPATRPVLNATVHQALARQDDLAPVLGLAAQALASPAAMAKLPVEAQRLMQMLLGLKIETPAPGTPKSKAGLNAEALKAAVAASGVFFEQGLANGKPPGPQGDLKALLLALTGLLAKEEAEPAPPPERPAPPIRRDEPEAREAGRSIALDPPRALKQLSDAANAALDRVRLLQYASLDGAVDGAPARHDPQPGQAREVMFELPFQVGRETQVVPFKVSREAPERRDGEGVPEPVWKLSFAIAVEPIGPVHARLTLRGERLDVRLYAERPEVAARMAAASGDLRKALGDDGLLDLDGVTVEPGRPGTAASGVDRRA